MDWIQPGFSVHGILQARILECVAFSFSRGSSDPGIKSATLASPALAGTFFTTEPPGSPSVCVSVCVSRWIYMCESESHSVVSSSLRPLGLYSPWNSPGRNTGRGSLSLPQGIFPTQGSNQCLLHCKRILYQLSYRGGPIYTYICIFFSLLVTFISWNSALTGFSHITLTAGKNF